MDSRANFTDRAVPVLAAVVGSPVEGRAMVVLVIDDTGDDDIVAAIAAVDTPFARGFDGEWGLFNDRRGYLARFTLKSETRQRHRRWLVDNPTLDVIMLLESDHVVALMPAEIAGDPTGGIDVSGLPARLSGSLVVEVISQRHATAGH